MILTRPEKSDEMTALVYAIREAAIAPARAGDLNLAEVINAFGQALSSIIAGAYDDKNREVMLMALPDLVRAYFPQWDAIYSDASGGETDAVGSVTRPERGGA